MVNLISTRDVNKKERSYTDALLAGLAPDGGLYIPIEYPQVTDAELTALRGKPYVDVAFFVKQKLIGTDIPEETLKQLITQAYAKEKFAIKDDQVVPLQYIGEQLFLENLSLGPTAAFKDMALQQLGQEMNYVLEKEGKTLRILGATSGDTGSSAEAALKGLQSIKLFMLSPTVGMSDFQKAQMGQLTGDNIFNISVNGRFDDCQDLVKAINTDPEFADLGAVNSINWGRISSQVPYYVSGYLQATKNNAEQIDVVVPSGNFGNILAGYIAKKMGVPIRKLIIATNENTVLDTLVKTGVYKVTPSQITSSPSMDISKASNFERLLFDFVNRDATLLADLMKEFSQTGQVDLNRINIKEKFADIGFSSSSSTHADRLATIKRVYNESGVVIDPHTADGVKVAFEQERDIPMLVMQTALSVKFEHTIQEAIGFVPKREERFVGLEENGTADDAFVVIDVSEEELKSYIRKH